MCSQKGGIPPHIHTHAMLADHSLNTAIFVPATCWLWGAEAGHLRGRGPWQGPQEPHPHPGQPRTTQQPVWECQQQEKLGTWALPFPWAMLRRQGTKDLGTTSQDISRWMQA